MCTILTLCSHVILVSVFSSSLRRKADESDGNTSSSFSFGSDIDFELTVDDLPKTKKVSCGRNAACVVVVVVVVVVL